MANDFEGLDSESAQIRDVFAWFGAAVFQAQGLERQLAINLAAHYGTDPAIVTKADFDELLEMLFSKTLGSLTQSATDLPEITTSERNELEEALRKRNWLAHNYFWEKAIDFLSESGRASMIEELRDAAHQFEQLDRHFTR